MSKLHILWILPLLWPVSLTAGVRHIPFVSQFLIWPAYVYASILSIGTGVSLSSPSKKSPWAARRQRRTLAPDEMAATVLAEFGLSDNFEYIALNMALFRYALEAKHAHRFPDEDSLLVACGVLDTIVHIQNGHFTVQNLKEALQAAKLGECQLGLTDIVIDPKERVGRPFGIETDLFLDYTLNIEALCFYAVERFVASDGLSAQDIILAVLDKRDDIARVLHIPNKTLAWSNVAPGVRQLAAAFMDSPDFGDFRREIGLE